MGYCHFQKGQQMILAKNFNSKEFECHCEKDHDNLISVELVDKLQALRDMLRKPVRVNSGYRCLEHNMEVYRQLGKLNAPAATKSKHIDGLAADIRVEGMSVKQLADHCRKIGFSFVLEEASWVHVDMR